MKKNVGLADRIIRVLAAVVVAALYFTNQITGTAAIILGLGAAIMLLTSAMGFCPIWFALKISTKKSKA